MASERRPSARDVVFHLLGLVDPLEVDDRDVRAFGGQGPRVRGADALRRAGDDADLAVETIPHVECSHLQK